MAAVVAAHEASTSRVRRVLLIAALLVAVGASSASAGVLITGNNIKNNTVTSRNVKDATILSSDVSNGSLSFLDIQGMAVRGDTGLQGSPGVAGEPGPAGPNGQMGLVFKETRGDVADGERLTLEAWCDPGMEAVGGGVVTDHPYQALTGESLPLVADGRVYGWRATVEADGADQNMRVRAVCAPRR